MICYSCNCDADHELSSMQVTHEELRSRCGTYAYPEYNMYINTIFYFLAKYMIVEKKSIPFASFYVDYDICNGSISSWCSDAFY